MNVLNGRVQLWQELLPPELLQEIQMLWDLLKFEAALVLVAWAVLYLVWWLE